MLVHIIIGSRCERAGTKQLAGNVSRHGVAIGQTVITCRVEHAMVAFRHRDHAGKFGPTEPGQGGVASPVNRVGHAKAMAVEPVHPLLGIVVDPKSTPG